MRSPMPVIETTRRSLLLGCGAATLVGCATALPRSAPAPGLYFPPPGEAPWTAVSPAEAGWDTERLEAALAFAGERQSGGVAILHRGRLVAERYWQGRDLHSVRDIASAQKSVMAILVGAAIERHGLSLADPAHRWLGPGWSKASAQQEAAITVRHLITMTSGLDETLAYQGAAGAIWRYNNEAYHQNHPIIEKAAGKSLQAFSDEVLFGPLGMQHAQWRRRADGKYGLLLSPRDMARFGLFILAGARWGQAPPLVRPAYLRDALNTSQPLNPSYGYLWWLNGKGSYRFPGGAELVPRSIVPNAPADLVAALGAADQKIYVVPSLDLVVARQGERGGAPSLAVSSFDNEWWGRLMAARRPVA